MSGLGFANRAEANFKTNGSDSNGRNNIKDSAGGGMQKSSSVAQLPQKRQASPLGGANFFSNRNSQMSLARQKQVQ